MAYCLLLRYDAAGLRPVLLREDERPEGDQAGVRYRFVASIKTLEEAEAMLQLYKRASYLHADMIDGD
jgi:hypothetical protein